jgi:hypothetical protein
MKTNLAPTGQAWLLEPMRSLRRGEFSVSGALAQRWCAEERAINGRGCPGADSVGGVSPVPVQMWAGRAQSRRRCGKGEPSPGADVVGMSPCPGADVGRVSPVPVQMWHRYA